MKVKFRNIRHIYCQVTLLLIFAIFSTAVGQDFSPTDLPSNGPLEAKMRIFLTVHRVPGVSVAVGKDGKVVFAEGFGLANVEEEKPVTRDSLFRIASISKPITAVAILQLVEEGKISLHDNPFILIGLGDAIKSPGVDPRLADITLQHLLSHRAGWDRGAENSYDPMHYENAIVEALDLKGPPDQNDIIQFMVAQPLNFTPGKKHKYSNFGYCLLGRVIEHITGQRYEDVVLKCVLEPLRIINMKIGRSQRDEAVKDEVVYYDLEKNSENSRSYSSNPKLIDASGGWIASAVDLVTFANAFTDPSNCPLLKEETIKLMWEKIDDNSSYSLGWHVQRLDKDKKTVWHSGALNGCCSSRMIRYSDGITVVALFNTDKSKKNGSYLANELFKDKTFRSSINKMLKYRTR